MACLVEPVSVLIRRCSGKYSSSRLGYRPLAEGGALHDDDLVTVVVGKEKKEFLVDSFVLQESPFRALIELAMKGNDKNRRRVLEMDGIVANNKRVIFVDVDAILFEHMLWLMHNDCSSLFTLNVKEIIDFYAQDI